MTSKSNSSLILIVILLSMGFINNALFTGIPLPEVLAQGKTQAPSNHTFPAIENDFLEYKNPNYGVRLQYPSDWKASEKSVEDYTNIITFYSPLENISDRFPENVGISITPYSQNITLDDYNTQVATGLNMSPGIVRLIESNSTTLADNPAYRIAISPQVGNNSQFMFKIMRIWTIEDNNVYAIAYTAEPGRYDNYLPTVQKMIDSFEIADIELRNITGKS